MSAPGSITWHDSPAAFEGDIGVAVQLSANRWTELGASFASLDDREGGTFGLAGATIEVGDGPLTFGVLDYGDEITYLLVPARGERKEQFTTETVKALLDVGILAESEILPEGEYSGSAHGEATISLGYLPALPATSARPGAPHRVVESPQRLARAVAHPLRVRILASLREEQASPNELANTMDEPLSWVAYHCMMLEKAGLIELTDTKQRRGATEHFYRAVPEEKTWK